MEQKNNRHSDQPAAHSNAAIYLRVSTRDKGQDADNQRRQLRQFCETQQFHIVEEYEDHESGSKGDRAAFQRMLRDSMQHRFDVIIFWALDRFTREGTLATLQYLQTLERSLAKFHRGMDR